MKVYRFLDMHTSRQANHPGQNQTRVNHSSLAKMSGPGGDVIDISPEARELYEKAHVHEIEALRARKLARDYMPLVRELIGEHQDPRNVYRTGTVEYARAVLADGDIRIEGREAPSRTLYLLMLLIA